MFGNSFTGCIEQLWSRLHLGAPVFDESNRTIMNVDGAELFFADAKDGSGVAVSIDVGAFAKNTAVRQRQMEQVLQTNLAVITSLPVLVEVMDDANERTRLVLSVHCRGYQNQEKMIGLVEDLLAAQSLYSPMVGDEGEGLRVGDNAITMSHNPLSGDLEGAMVFQL